jgi:antagonist of KipI
MDIIVEAPGLWTTVQDSGRPGYQRFGVAHGGAMDRDALRTANLLVGNAEGEAALEITLAGPTLVFAAAGLIALCGAGFAAELDGGPLPMRRPVAVRPGSRLAIGAAVRGCRAYLAVAGGLDLPRVMGSRSTDVRAGFGGCGGRALRAGDRLPVGRPAPQAERLCQALLEAPQPAGLAAARWSVALPPQGRAASPPVLLRAVRGPECAQFAAAAAESFFADEFTVSAQSDRMGCRLDGRPLGTPAAAGGMSSTAVTAGTVQVPPDGRPILLMADAQTIGGYPRIAHVAAVDMPTAAQLRPGSRIRFREISLLEAQALLIEREQSFARLKLAIRQQFDRCFSTS